MKLALVRLPLFFAGFFSVQALAAPSESDRFNRLYGGFQLLHTEETQMRVPMAITGLIVGPTLLVVAFADYRVGAPSVACGVIGGAMIGMGAGSLLFSGPLDHIQSKIDAAQGQSGKLEVLEDTLRRAAEMSRGARKVGTWFSAIMTPVSAALAIDQYSRGSGGATGWLITSTLFLSLGINSLLFESPYEKLWNDYREWSGVPSKSAGLQLRPNFSVVSLRDTPAVSAGFSISWN